MLRWFYNRASAYLFSTDSAGARGLCAPRVAPAGRADPQVTVPSNILANSGGSVTLPITIDDASQLQSSLLQFTVDPSKLTL